MEPRNEIELIQQVGEWTTAQGWEREPEWGVVEEVGEAAHAILKNIQHIRGYDFEKFQADFTDSLADAIIFLCDWCALHQAFFKFKRNELGPVVEQEKTIMAHVLQCASALFRYPFGEPSLNEGEICSVIAQRLATALECWAKFYKYDLSLLVAATWPEVRKRNWKQFPKNGLTE
jgi:NTP pyrophosphatase (non-canonical NTP hydrolase)